MFTTRRLVGTTGGAVMAALIIAGCGAESSTSPATSTAGAATGALTNSVVAPAAALNITGGATKVDIDPATAMVLQQHGVSVAPVAPATAAMVNGTVEVTFPVTTGYAAIYPNSDLPYIRGSIAHSGGITFSGGGKSLTAKDFVINPGVSSLTATVGGKGVPLLDLAGDKATVSNDSAGVHINGVVASLSTTAADALNSTFGVSLFARGIKVGVANVTVAGGADPGGAPSAQVEQLSGQATSVLINAATAQVLQQHGVSVAPVGPATASTSGALTVTFPITSGYVAVYPKSNLPFIRGLITHSGGLTFSAGSKSLTVTDFVIDPGTSQLFATVAGSGAVVPLLDLHGNALTMSADSSGAIHIDNVTATLSSAAAGALNATFGVTLFTAGIPIGVASVVAVAVTQ
ncbi:MAG: hypothetical protein ABI473_05885 [Candidatus Dormibacter sp.]